MSHYKTIAALGKPIVIHTNITRFLGSMTASALLSYIMYWSERTDRRLGFYRSLDEMMAETALSQHELRSARKRLTELGLISETYKRLEHRLYFRFNADVFDRWFEACLSEQAASQDFAKNADDGFADLIDKQDGQMRNPQMPPVKSAIRYIQILLQILLQIKIYTRVRIFLLPMITHHQQQPKNPKQRLAQFLHSAIGRFGIAKRMHWILKLNLPNSKTTTKQRATPGKIGQRRLATG